MKEEDILLKKLGKENSFKVPDGYFENLTSEVMNKLPEKEKVAFKEEPVSTWTRLKPLLYMAAMFVRYDYFSIHFCHRYIICCSRFMIC